MADADVATSSRSSSPEPLTRLPFPPVTKQHILNCSYHSWHPLYRSSTPKARLIPLTPPFLSYLREDGIVLPSDNDSDHQTSLTDTDSGIFSAEDDSEDDEALLDPSIYFRDIHQKIKETIAELGGKVTPKLNWSAPKDATWIAATNSMECRTPSDIYLLLKSSDFITHDLEHAFDDCIDEDDKENPSDVPGSGAISHPDPKSAIIPYHLILRKSIPNLNPALEFRCFVRNRTLLAICQRDLNHFDFLFPMRDRLLSRIQAFFDQNLKESFPDPNFVFDVYIPSPHTRVWLVDLNPWAPRTDPLLFSWLEILTLPEPRHGDAHEAAEAEAEPETVRLRLSAQPEPEPTHALTHPSLHSTNPDPNQTPFSSTSNLRSSSLPSSSSSSTTTPSSSSDNDSEDHQILPFTPELRLISATDPEAYAFNTPRYSAHKLPRDVVHAAANGDVEGEGGLREFVGVWKDLLARRRREEEEEEQEDEVDG
ncbi:hypothetical protein MMC16_002357 [Acarospora aff. strigata]|nr:hypothetical protein [Acarospora aff. strigata]